MSAALASVESSFHLALFTKRIEWSKKKSLDDQEAKMMEALEQMCQFHFLYFPEDQRKSIQIKYLQQLKLWKRYKMMLILHPIALDIPKDITIDILEQDLQQTVNSMKAKCNNEIH